MNFGYYYQGSPIISHDGEAPPPYSMAEFAPSTVPGTRMPHFWLGDGRSLYDALGSHYTRLRFDPDVDVAALMNAAAKVAMPLKLVDVSAVEVPDVILHELLLVRSDQHIAWRGDVQPEDAERLVGLLRGAP